MLVLPPPLVGAGKPSRIKGPGLDFSLTRRDEADRQTKANGGVVQACQHEARLASLTLCSASGMARGAVVLLVEISNSASSMQRTLEQVVQWLAAASCGVLSTVAPLAGVCSLTHTRER